MDIKDGGPAFPIPLHEGQSYQGHAPCDGMTLRDYFAAKVLIMFVEDLDPRAASDMAYQYADAMLAAREASHD